MTSMIEHPAVQSEGNPAVYKGLHIGESGVGKTGMLASLVNAGYKLRVLDFDAGLDPLAGYVKDKSKLANVDYETLRDQFVMSNNYLIVDKAPAFQRAMSLLNSWGDYGNVETWGRDTILVVDTLGKMSRASYNMILWANGIRMPSGKKGGPEQSHYGTAQDNVDRLLLNLTNPDLVPCHVIVNAHWTYQEAGEGLVKPFPETIGKALSPTVARNFNNLFSVSISAGGQRSIKVKRDRMIPCKSSIPLSKDEYPIETGMADIFREIVGPPPSGG